MQNLGEHTSDKEVVTAADLAKIDNKINEAKTAINAAFAAKGVSVPADVELKQYAEYVNNILDLDGENFDYLMTKGEHRFKLFPFVDLKNCTSFTYFMNECKLDESGNKITKLDLRNLKLEGAKISNGNYAFNALTNCTELILPESKWNVRSQNYMFAAFAGTQITNIEILGDETGVNSTTDHRNMFRNCPNLLEADLSGITARVCTANYWQNCFYQCPKIRKVWLPKTIINIAATTQAYSMFNNSNAACQIFTDAPAMPATWTGLWNYHNTSTAIKINFNATHLDYENY